MPGCDAFGALFGEEDADGVEHKLEIRHHVHLVYVQKVKLQLFVGVRVVLPVDLGVAREARLDLEAELELGQVFFILARDLRALRPGSDDGHVALQDVDKLGQLVQAAGADKVAHRRDARVPVAGGKPRDAVLLRVNTHRAELDDLKLPAVLREAHLLVKDRAAVVGLDQDGRQQEKGTQHNEAEKRDEDIKGALDRQILERFCRTAHGENRRCEGFDVRCAAHDNVPDMGQEEAADIVLGTVFAQAVHQRRVHARDEERVIAPDLILQAEVVRIVILDELFDLKEPLNRLAGDIAEAPQIVLVAIDNHGAVVFDQLVIILVGVKTPKAVPRRHDDEHREENQRVQKMEPGDGNREINDHRAENIRQRLGERKLANPKVPQRIGVIGLVEPVQQE